MKTTTKTRAESAKKGEGRVRDRFTFPAADYELLLELRKRAASVELPSKRSELLRAGLHALSKLRQDDFVATVRSVLAVAGKPGEKG